MIIDSSLLSRSFFTGPFLLTGDVAGPVSLTWHTGLEGLDQIPSLTKSVSGV